MKMKSAICATAAAAATLLGGAAQAQHARVQSVDNAPARAAMEASMKAAARGQRVGMLTGRLNPAPVALAGGGVAQELDATTLMFSVARVNADGSIERICVSGDEDVERALRAPSFAKRMNQLAKENGHVTQ